MPDAIFACPDPTTFWRLDELGLEMIRQRLELDEGRRRVQQQHGQPIRCRGRRTLRTGADGLTERRHERITALFAVQEHVEVEATWGI